MPYYVSKALYRLQHPKPKITQYDPHCWSVSVYGKILQMAPDPDERDILEKFHQENTVHCGDHAILFMVSRSNDTMGN